MNFLMKIYFLLLVATPVHVFCFSHPGGVYIFSSVQILLFHYCVLILFLSHLESSVQLKEEKMAHKKDEKSVLPEGKSTRQNRDKIKLQGLKQKVDHAVPGDRKSVV